MLGCHRCPPKEMLVPPQPSVESWAKLLISVSVLFSTFLALQVFQLPWGILQCLSHNWAEIFSLIPLMLPILEGAIWAWEHCQGTGTEGSK